jgi:hypothetical protein
MQNNNNNNVSPGVDLTNSAASAAASTSAQDLWNSQISHVHVCREELNKLIMNYLILEGHKEGALTFQRESGVQADEMDLDLIDARVMVKSLINQGEIESAIRAINDLNPEVSSFYNKSRFWTEIPTFTSN